MWLNPRCQEKGGESMVAVHLNAAEDEEESEVSFQARVPHHGPRWKDVTSVNINGLLLTIYHELFPSGLGWASTHELTSDWFIASFPSPKINPGVQSKRRQYCAANLLLASLPDETQAPRELSRMECNMFDVHVCIYLEPICPLFWGLDPQKRGLSQSKQGSCGFQEKNDIYIYIHIYVYRCTYW